MDRYTQGTVVTANARLSRELRREYDTGRRQSGLQVWESPDILPRNAWLTRAWRECAYRDPFDTPVLLSTAQEEALWERAIASTSATSGATWGATWDPPLEGPGDESSLLLDLPATVSAAAQAWSAMHAWELGCASAEFQGVRDTEMFLHWMQAIKRRLREEGWITASELPRALFDRVTAGGFAPGPHSYAGFDELTPADGRLFTACRAKPSQLASSEPPRRRYRVELHDCYEELRRAASWARRKLEENPGARIGIVVRGLAGISAAAERIFDDIFYPGLEFARSDQANAYYISAGVPAADVPVIAQAMLLLGLKPGLRMGEAGMLLRSPFLGGDNRQSARLAAQLRRGGLQKISFALEAVRRAFPLMSAVADELPDTQHPSEWSATFSKLLRRAAWPGDRPLNAAERQAVEHWKELLSEFAALDLVLPRMSYGEALQRLRRMADDRRFAVRDEDAPVQVIDVTEAAGLHFDALWAAGLQGGAWPAAARPSPFLPLSEQRAAGMPHSAAEAELAHARRVTDRLLASAPEVICSYPLFSGEEKLRVSPLIEALPIMPREEAWLNIHYDTALRKIFASPAPLKVRGLGPAAPLPQGTFQTGGMYVLADQAACPFRAFAIHRLGAREPDAPDIGISPSERGNVAHQALQLLWREIKSQRELRAMSGDERTAVIEKCVGAALDSRLSRRQPDASLDRSRAVEQSRLQHLLAEWLGKEEARPDFEVVESEQARRIEAGGLELEVRADRVDRMAGGEHEILDYKTSDKLSVQDWEGERPDAPQLPLYVVTSNYEVCGVYFAKVVPDKTDLLGLKGDELRARIPDWTRVVDQLGASFLRGDAAVDPKNPGKTCEWCHLHSLCRIADPCAAGIVEDAAGE